MVFILFIDDMLVVYRQNGSLALLSRTMNTKKTVGDGWG